MTNICHKHVYHSNLYVLYTSNFMISKVYDQVKNQFDLFINQFYLFIFYNFFSWPARLHKHKACQFPHFSVATLNSYEPSENTKTIQKNTHNTILHGHMTHKLDLCFMILLIIIIFPNHLLHII